MVLGCGAGGSNVTGAAAPAESGSPAAASAQPVATASATAEAKPVESAAATVAPPAAPAAAPKSTHTIGGVSASDVDAKGVQAALEKAGYGLIGPTDATTCGDVEQLQLSLTRKGKPVGIFTILRKAKAKAADCSPTSIKESFEVWKKPAAEPGSTSALVYDEKADVLVVVNLLKGGSAAAAKALLDGLVVKP